MKNKINLIFWLYSIDIVLIILGIFFPISYFTTPLIASYIFNFILYFIIFSCVFNFILSINIYRKSTDKKIKRSNLNLLIITTLFLVICLVSVFNLLI